MVGNYKFLGIGTFLKDHSAAELVLGSVGVTLQLPAVGALPATGQREDAVALSFLTLSNTFDIVKQGTTKVTSHCPFLPHALQF